MSAVKDDFVHLHTHSDASTLDGCGKLSDYVQEAHSRGNPALAFTEHGTMRGMYNFITEVKENAPGLKPIFGIEFYVCEDMFARGLTDEEKTKATAGLKKDQYKSAIKDLEEKLGRRDRWHMTVWARTDAGLKNLYKLSSMAWTDGFYYKPRIDLKTLMEYGDGLSIGSGCVTSPITDNWIQGKKEKALDTADMLYERFGQNFWLEIQPHDLSDHSQFVGNTLMKALRKRYNTRLLATQDAHYIHQTDHDHHEVLLCIGTGTTITDPNRFCFDGDGFHLRTRREMQEAFERHHNYLGPDRIKESLDSTMLLAEQCEAKVVLDYYKCLLPPQDIPAEFHGDDFAYLRHLCLEGMKWRDIPTRARALADREGREYGDVIREYGERLKRELLAIRTQKFVGYFLMVHDLYKWVRSRGIACGPGRGSAAGSIVSFLTGITSVDPIEHKLLFERFISPTRIDMPDIDMDFEDVRREEILAHLRERYGVANTAQIATIGKLSGKQCLISVSRVLEIPYMEVKQVTASIIERSSGDERASQTIEDSFKEFKVCREFNEKYPDVLRHSKHLEGMAKTLGIHAAGIVCSPVPLTEILPLETRRSGDGEPKVVTAFDMYGAMAFGLLKMDVLGLRTMTVLREACEAIKEHHGIDLDLEKLALNEPDVLQGFTDHDYVGIFQYDTPGADKICAGVVFSDFEDVAAMTALNRPGTARSGLASEYVARKKNPELIKKDSFHPKVTEITKDTLGIMVYQEHVLRIFTDIAGFAPATADSLRKTIAKKLGDETIGRERENFINGAVKHTEGMDRETAGRIMDAITFFGSYGFNKSHATCYGVIAYWSMYLKRRYPMEFFCALLKNEPDRMRIQTFAKDIRHHGIEILPADVNTSRNNFSIDREHNAIRGSLSDIKNVGMAAAKVVMAQQPFADAVDFLKRTKGKVNKRVATSLAQAGALDHTLPNIKWFCDNIDELWPNVMKGKWEAVAASLAASASMPDWTSDEKVLKASALSPLAFGKHPIDAWSDFLGGIIKVDITSMGGEDFFDQRHCFISGIMVEKKYNQVGDFHTGEMPSEEERTKMKWGSRYANINIEDASGKQNRAKVDWDIFDDFREIVDSPMTTPMIAHVSLNKKYENMRAHLLVNIAELHRKTSTGEPLNIWERLVTGDHPALTYPFGTPEEKRLALFDVEIEAADAKTRPGGKFTVTGVIGHVKTKLDKRMNEMAWFGVYGVKGWIEVVCFGSTWPLFKAHIKPGAFLTLGLQNDRKGGGIVLDDRDGFVKCRTRTIPAPEKSVATG